MNDHQQSALEIADLREQVAQLTAMNAKLNEQAVRDAKRIELLQSELIPPKWISFESGGCPRCGDDIHAERSDEEGFNDSSPARCGSCGLPGQIDVDEDGTASFSEDDPTYSEVRAEQVAAMTIELDRLRKIEAAAKMAASMSPAEYGIDGVDEFLCSQCTENIDKMRDALGFQRLPAPANTPVTT